MRIEHAPRRRPRQKSSSGTRGGGRRQRERHRDGSTVPPSSDAGLGPSWPGGHIIDGDMVSETNCVRQPFSWSDVGQNKAIVLINRINLFWGTHWRAEPMCFDETTLERINDRSAIS